MGGETRKNARHPFWVKRPDERQTTMVAIEEVAMSTVTPGQPLIGPWGTRPS